ncbi:MAG: hypothetical protein ACO1N9_14805 [Flavobacterium sp.]
MKKYMAIVALMVIAAVGCSASKNVEKGSADTSITKMEYKAYTRGSNKEVTVTRDKVEVKEIRLGKNIEATYPLSKDNWNKLLALAQKIKLDKMEALEAPSKKHQFDGAMAANLTVTANGITYQSVTFDDGNPPSEIKALVDEIIGISGVGKIQVKE